MRRLRGLSLMCVALAATLAATGALADGDKEKRMQTEVSTYGATLFPPGHPLFDPASAGQLRDDCTGINAATGIAIGTGRASYIGAVYNEQSHCALLDENGIPTGAFILGRGAMTGKGTDSDGVRDQLFYEYEATLLNGLPPGPPAWCDPTTQACPITANGRVRYTGGAGRFSRVELSEWDIAFVFGAPDGLTVVHSDGTITSNGPLPGSY